MGGVPAIGEAVVRDDGAKRKGQRQVEQDHEPVGDRAVVNERTVRDRDDHGAPDIGRPIDDAVADSAGVGGLIANCMKLAGGGIITRMGGERAGEGAPEIFEALSSSSSLTHTGVLPASTKA